MSNQSASKIERDKQTTIVMERVEQAEWASAAANESRRQKEELQQRIANEAAANKIKDDYIQSSK